MAQVEEHLHKALSSNSSTTKKEKRKCIPVILMRSKMYVKNIYIYVIYISIYIT
jgi:hypothetical protein